MKIAQIIHNPTAGDTRHNKEGLENLVKNAGFESDYVSTDDENWEKFYRNKMDVILLAGGDGSIRKLARVLIKRKMTGLRIPIRLLPLGTANNIAETLQIRNDNNGSYKLEGDTIRFDCGLIEGMESEKFFIESVGMGIFPELISEMKNYKFQTDDTAGKLKETLKVLKKIVKDYQAKKARMKIDGITIEGTFLMVELMNIKSLGPNLKLAANADPGDGYFDLVMIPDQKRDELENYLEKMINGKPEIIDLNQFVKTIRVQKLKMKWFGSKVHVDDSLINDYSVRSFKAEIVPGALEFLKTH
jgi:diacylglycerol kinase (ATP)